MSGTCVTSKWRNFFVLRRACMPASAGLSCSFNNKSDVGQF